MPYPVPPHPGFADPLALKFWEIRHQLAINVEMIERDYPQEKPAILPHIAETLTGHVFDRLAELEAMVSDMQTGARQILPYLEYTIGEESPGHHPTMA